MSTPLNENNQGQSKTTIRMTPEEVEKIKSLPRRTFLIGNVRQTGLYDTENKRFYYLDANGEWTGRLAIINTPPPAKEAEPEAEEDENNPTVPGPETNSHEDDDVEGDGKQGLPNKIRRAVQKLMTPISPKVPITKLHVLAAGIILLIVVVLFVGPSINQTFTPTQEPPADTQEPVGEENTPTPPPADNGSIETIQVIQAKGTLIPGDAITQDNICSAEISAADYELLRANGRILYQWEVAGNLIGMVVNKYIPKGGYIASGDESDTYSPPSNPWINEQAGKSYVTLPLDASTSAAPELNYGGKVDILIKKTITTQTTEQEDGTIATTTYEKEYTFSNAIICDILNANQESIYSKYTAYIAIPAGERFDYIQSALKQNPDLAAALSPAYIRIKIDSAVADEIGNFNAQNLSITYTLKGSDMIDATTDTKREFATQARALDQTIEQALAAALSD